MTARDGEMEKREEARDHRRAVAHAPHPHRRGINHPKTPIPTFSDPTKQSFMTFWSLFTQMVDEDDELTEVRKLALLISYLDGTPKRLIEGLDLTPDNYDIAKEILEEQYYDKESTIRKLNDALLAQKASSGGKDDFTVWLESNTMIRQLAKLGKDMPDAWMSLEEKLSKPTLREIMNKKTEAEGIGETWDTKKFLKALGKIVSKEANYVTYMPSSIRLRSQTIVKRRIDSRVIPIG